MKVRLNRPILGYRQDAPMEDGCKHADKDDILQVIFRNATHFVCISKYHPDKSIAVFNSQCNIVDRAGEDIVEDPHAEEKYYHVYEDKSNLTLDDPFHTAFEFDDPQ